jgi:hypothetical protein
VSREVHAGICESRRVRLPPATRHLEFYLYLAAALTVIRRLINRARALYRAINTVGVRFRRTLTRSSWPTLAGCAWSGRGGCRMSGDLGLRRRIRSIPGWCVVMVVTALIGIAVEGCGAAPRGPVSEPTPALAGVHPCDPAALGAPSAGDGAGGPFRGPGGVRFSCATLTVPLDHVGLRAAPRQPGRLSLQVAMAENTTAPRGVLVWLVGRERGGRLRAPGETLGADPWSVPAERRR